MSIIDDDRNLFINLMIEFIPEKSYFATVRSSDITCYYALLVQKVNTSVLHHQFLSSNILLVESSILTLIISHIFVYMFKHCHLFLWKYSLTPVSYANTHLYLGIYIHISYIATYLLKPYDETSVIF